MNDASYRPLLLYAKNLVPCSFKKIFAAFAVKSGLKFKTNNPRPGVHRLSTKFRPEFTRRRCTVLYPKKSDGAVFVIHMNHTVENY